MRTRSGSFTAAAAIAIGVAAITAGTAAFATGTCNIEASGLEAPLSTQQPTAMTLDRKTGTLHVTQLDGSIVAIPIVR